MEWYSFGGGATVGTLVILLSVFLSKVWVNRIFAKDRITYQTKMEVLLQTMQTQGGKELWVHQLQFEKEFEVYKELWKAGLLLGRVVRLYEPVQIGEFVGEEDRAERLAESYNHFRDVVFENRPFYAPAVYEAATLITGACQKIDMCRTTISRLKSARKPGSIHEQRSLEKIETHESLIEEELKTIRKALELLVERIHLRVFRGDAELGPGSCSQGDSDETK